MAFVDNKKNISQDMFFNKKKMHMMQLKQKIAFFTQNNLYSPSTDEYSWQAKKLSLAKASGGGAHHSNSAMTL